ncbi:putative SAM-dependent methyltransferase [Leptolyngbya boryana NIES-2135]|jgi:SAM-dependent methyltransferase|uniref:Putative SAM-dependent methyltransferase n=1 Tax=Leptolyngbya boryana NIES-2135 TaxID=1973484 RepID=A0A1Z4JKJ4_LEPBY|nr:MULTISPECIES: class I SAM-dependent methyltransferase [Leptolyngbya]BAY57275.1 putative SAM-dependent methyltransferase [Leptolyngbya boryana NIES-2135]MBD1857420.1 class I SAM-dependent methyltransferase [Leptolyngbya sp. FACHB-1624]MBD2366975.1 class I SAM-dependent methyltransferase [Leptolyngbya sp. FACHB-161]MBD2373671.1 class I SAM-dependent methyltransferase [Leptolyngbya sp. FACHB-238]MBD2398080.1 class I SAM-dependent methyltransferase [Leptolyngbya sp. FACHB-239]
MLRRPDIAFIPTPEAAIETLLEVLQVNDSDVIYDLGCGDGRILISAALQFGARGVGIDLDPLRVKEAQAKADELGIRDRVKFQEADLFTSRFEDASIVVLYLLPHLNLRLRPALFEQLKPGTRIVSIDFDMGDWLPEKVIKLDIEEESTLYFWTIPA